jgi:hypothetical protein
MPVGGARKGAGRKKGVPNKVTLGLREMMESITPNNEPVPMVLLRMGFQYHQKGMTSEAVNAISKAMEYAYPKLKHLELATEKDTTPKIEIIGIETT